MRASLMDEEGPVSRAQGPQFACAINFYYVKRLLSSFVRSPKFEGFFLQLCLFLWHKVKGVIAL